MKLNNIASIPDLQERVDFVRATLTEWIPQGVWTITPCQDGHGVFFDLEWRPVAEAPVRVEAKVVKLSGWPNKPAVSGSRWQVVAPRGVLLNTHEWPRLEQAVYEATPVMVVTQEEAQELRVVTLDLDFEALASAETGEEAEAIFDEAWGAMLNQLGAEVG